MPLILTSQKLHILVFGTIAEELQRLLQRQNVPNFDYYIVFQVRFIGYSF